MASLHEAVDIGRLAPALETVERVATALPADKAMEIAPVSSHILSLQGRMDSKQMLTPPHLMEHTPMEA